MKIRKIELTQSRGIIDKKQPTTHQEITPRETREELIANTSPLQGNEGIRQKILNLLEKQGELGMDIDMLIQSAALEEETAEKIIEELIKEGEVYMSRPGVIKII